MNQDRNCAKCSKVVYQPEEIKCLDKLWHKRCLKCEECNVTLNLQNCHAFNKMPFCRVHVPKPKATAVAVTPEISRVKNATRMQSNVEYHSDFEKNKDKYTPVSDTPESRRATAASNLISNVAYHGDLQKKAQMDLKRGLADPVVENASVSPKEDAYRHASTVIYDSSGPTHAEEVDIHVGSITEYEPAVTKENGVDHADGDAEGHKEMEKGLDSNQNYEETPKNHAAAFGPRTMSVGSEADE